MEIRHLEYFLEVARFRSFSLAAASIHVSQSTISKAVRELEEEIGRPLFLRTPKAILLTDVGEKVLPPAEQILSAFRNIVSTASQDAAAQVSRFHLGIPPITAIAAFSPVLGDFKRRYPKIEIVLHEYEPKRNEAELKADLLDLGIFTPENRRLFDWIWFENDLHAAVIPQTHPLAWREEIGYQDLRGVPLIIYNDDYKLHDIFLNGCAAAGLRPEIAFETVQKSMMLQLVAEGIGVAFLPRKACRGLPAGLTCRDFQDPDFRLELALTWKRGRPLPYGAELFLQHFREWVKRADV